MNSKQSEISNGAKVALEYTLMLDGEKIESNVGKDPLVYTHGSKQIVPGLERELTGMKTGQSKKVTVAPDNAYGPVQKDGFVEVKKSQVPDEAHFIGAQLSTQDNDGNVLRSRVTELKDDSVVLDFNHPLAGKTLVFDVRVVEVEKSSEASSN